MRSGTFVSLRKLKDADGRYLIQPDTTEAGAYRLLGHDVTVTNRAARHRQRGPQSLTPPPEVRVATVSNEIFRKRMDASIERAMNEAADCRGLDHQGLVGEVRQILVENLLKPLLPEGVQIGTGKITDSMGRLSAQTDVIIYDRRTVPPVLYDEKRSVSSRGRLLHHRGKV